jgi:hypothetical protein
LIDQEASRKSLLPSPSTYSINSPIKWGKESSINAMQTILPKAARITQFQIIAKMNKKPETSTPSPVVYKPDYNVILPKTHGAGHTTLKS